MRKLVTEEEFHPMSDGTIAVFAGSQNEATALRAREITGLGSADVLTFSRQSNDYTFPFAAKDVGALYSPLPRGRFDAIVVEQSCELFPGNTTIDWLAHMINSLVLGGRIFLSLLEPDQGAKLGRVDPSVSLTSLGMTPSMEGAWVVATKPSGWEAPRVNSVLGAYLQGRGDFVMNAFLGDAVRGTAPSRLGWFMGGNTLVNPDAPLDLARYDRKDLIRVVERCRAGEIQQGEVEEGIVRRAVDAVGSKESAGRLAAHMRSWQNYMMYGTAYKAASIASVLRREFGDQPIKFLEHGGYAGALSMQLLADLPSVQEAWCCEIDPQVLPNTQLLLERLPRVISERFRFSLTSVEEHVYQSDFDVVAFVHMLLYVRRDQLPGVLDQARAALRPGGVLLFLENTRPPTTAGGADDALIFSPDELDEYLSAIGRVKYAALKSGAGLSPEEAAGKQVMRMVQPRPYS